MKPHAAILAITLLVMPVSLLGEQPSENSNPPSESSSSSGSGVILSSSNRVPSPARPFSLAAHSEGLSPLGLQFQFATNVNKYTNLRSNLGVLSVGANLGSGNQNTTINAQVHMASLGTSLDLYPFPNHGLRFSSGVLFHNPFIASALLDSPGGGTFTLNGHTYSTPTGSDVKAVGVAKLSRSSAFTVSTGWGNMIPRSGGHFSFPVELGVAFLGSPTMSISNSLGQVCDAQGLNCQDAATDPAFQSDLQAVLAKYKRDLSLLKTYPIASFGIAYSFSLRSNARY